MLPPCGYRRHPDQGLRLSTGVLICDVIPVKTGIKFLNSIPYRASLVRDDKGIINSRLSLIQQERTYRAGRIGIRDMDQVDVAADLSLAAGTLLADEVEAIGGL